MWQLAVLVCLIILGLILEYFGVLDLHGAMEWFRGFSQTFWLPLVLILLQIILFMFALPGSAVLWIVAPIYEPLSATAILVSGSTLGGLAAYWFAHQARFSSLQTVRRHSLFVFLKKHADFFSLLGLRVFPGFPQSCCMLYWNAFRIFSIRRDAP